MACRVVLPALTGAPRLPDAASRLQRLVLQRMPAPFAWGLHDCALWAADAIEAQLGVDPAQALRGRYRTQLGACRLLAPWGGLAGVATAVLGPSLRSPLLACTGDVGFTTQGALAVCAGETWLVATSQGVGHLPLTDAVQAWRVGCA
jgi:hypothetical protein